MANIIVTIGGNISDSLSVNDLVFYAHLGAASGGFQSAGKDDVVYLGTVVTLDRATKAITIDVGSTQINTAQLIPTNKTMLLFSKNDKVNSTGLKGYYAEVKLQNTDTSKLSELFQVSSQTSLSSK